MTWLEWKSAVISYLLVDANRLGTETFRNNLLRQVAMDLQESIPQFRIGHESVFDSDDLVINGAASEGKLPPEANLKDSFIVKVGNKCRISPLEQYPWSNRNDLVCGRVRSMGGKSYMAINPNGTDFLVWPRISDAYALQLFWDGQRLEFDDSEEVPFTEQSTFCASRYLQSYFERIVNHDLRAAEVEMLDYRKKKGQLFIQQKERVMLKDDPIGAVQPNRACLPGCCPNLDPEIRPLDQIQFAAFADSGQVPLDETQKVATLVNGWEPDFIVHIGDTNYPNGSELTVVDYFKEFYWGYIQRQKWIQAWGNHDDDTDSGAPLMDILPWIADYNSGKRYYQIVTGPVTHFIVHSGISDANPDEPDGITAGSVQGQYIQQALQDSSNFWNIVWLHRPPYTSDVLYTPGSPVMRWPFKDWGADLVVSGHGHNYERCLVDGLQYVVAGLGGALKRGFGAVTTGSQVRYNSKHGSLLFDVTQERLQMNFINTDGTVIDTLILTKP